MSPRRSRKTASHKPWPPRTQANTSQSTAAQTNISNAIAVNTPVAIASLDQTMTALQAAIKTFGTVQSLGLFN